MNQGGVYAQYQLKGKPALRGLLGDEENRAVGTNHRVAMSCFVTSYFPTQKDSAFCFDAQVGNGSHAVLFSLNERTEVLL